ncbi:MAG TPA: bifunctional glycosyltransferase family 2 protein/CDP-glycerol:glycerophosphate glycerophosphotransferase [Streptosporangiaceae bacterium]|jgi:CDP-glycerol glycerophosphotransferase
MTARISVVVPFYNNEDLLGDCLQSIANQTYADLEVIMVDDGSVDGSTALAQAQAQADPRFSLIRVPNGGPGSARNHGIARATGEFLAFVDADDMLPSHAYSRMLHTLESSQSDFVSGNVERIGPAGITQSGLHSRAIKGRRIGTHISRLPELFWDVSVWNKLFRKSFWDAAGMSFPEGMLWEDLQAMTKAHVLAKAVDVIPDTIYYWRERGKGQLSITQSRTDITNFRDRITALTAIDQFLSGHSTRLLREHQRKALVNDLWLYVADLARTSDDYQAEFLELSRRYLARVDRRVFARLPSTHRLAYYLIRTGQLDRLIEFNAWYQAQRVKTIPVVRSFGRLRADLPFRKNRTMRIPGRVYRPYWRELDPFVRVDGLSWEGDKLVLSGAAFVPSIDITKRRHTSKIVILRPAGRRRLPPIVLVARSVQHPEATSWSGQSRYSYDWAGFRVAISPRWFRIGSRWLTGDWNSLILVRGRGVWRPARLHTPMRGHAERPEFRQVAPGIRFGARWVRRQLHIQVVDTPAVLHGCQESGGTLTIEADVTSTAQPGPAELVLTWPKNASTQTFPATSSRLDGKTLRVRAEVPVSAVQAGPPAADAPAELAAGTQLEWDLRVQADSRGPVRVAFPPGEREFRHVMGAREVGVERNIYGNAVIVSRTVQPVIEEHRWSEDGRLTLAGSFPAAVPGRYEAVLSRRSSTDQHVLAFRRDGDRFTIEIRVTAMSSFGSLLPLRDGNWDIQVCRADSAAADLSQPAVPRYDHGRLSEIEERKHVFGPKSYQFTTSGYDIPILVVGAALKLAEQGRVQRRMLRGLYYPLQMKLPLRDAVMFISWKGKQCGDNPGGIASELRRRGDDREHIWAVSDWSVPVPEGARAVLSRTEEYYEALGRSRYVISNDDMPGNYVKRDGQVYVQTWHGTPLKRIGFDIEQPQFISGTSYFDHLARDVAKWDLLLSPNPFSTPVMRRAFHYDGEICESGYPRNDVLHSADAAAVAGQVRQRLGLPDGKKTVLYAPTWRDNQYYASGRYRFDFRLDLERAWQALGDDYVILIRGHHHMSDDVPAGTRPGFAVNVTGYPEISELFLASDILVTDYSSVMFDFAPTGKPMLFFTYDFEQYRDTLRGFYFDFAEQAPGPLLTTSDEVTEAIAGIDSVAASHRGAYAAFTAKYCPLDDGKAGARACDRIFGG